MPFCQRHEVRIGCVFIARKHWERNSIHIVCEKPMCRPCVEFRQGFLRLNPRRLIDNAQANA